MIDELATAIDHKVRDLMNDAMACGEKVDEEMCWNAISTVIRAELAKSSGCELLAVSNGNLRCMEYCLLYHDIDLLLIQLAAARERMKRMQDAVDDFFEPEPESIREKNIDAIMEAFRTDQEPKRIEMTPEEMEAAEKNFAAFDRLKAFSKYAQEASDDTRNT